MFGWGFIVVEIIDDFVLIVGNLDDVVSVGLYVVGYEDIIGGCLIYDGYF